MAVKQVARVGADPEFFVKKEGKIIPICGLVGGTKERPAAMEGYEARRGDPGIFSYQEDGVAFEFNIPAASGIEYMERYIRDAMIYSEGLLGQKGLVPDYRSWYRFPPGDLTDQRANNIGCSSDWSAYGPDSQPFERKPFTAEDLGDTRFCGGHIHVGYNIANVPEFVMAKFIDCYATLPSLKADKQRHRRKFYGLPGLFRKKEYGIEYRTFSNFWLRPKFRQKYFMYLMGTIFDLALTANNNPHILSNAYGIIPWDDVREAIEQENAQLALQVWKYATANAKVPMRYSAELWSAEA